MSRLNNKEDNNTYMRNYFSKNPLVNALHCHNSERKKKGLNPISMEEFKQFREFAGFDSMGRIKSKKIDLWEKNKVKS